MVKGSLLFLVLSSLLLAPPARAASIDQYCQSIVGEYPSLIATCRAQETSARATVAGSQAEPRIKQYCQSIVGDSFALQDVCITQELQAKANISRRQVSAATRTYCNSIVGNSYALTEVCITQTDGPQ